MKRIIAREWLFLISFFLLGSILTILFYFNDNDLYIEKNNLYIEKRHQIYDALTEEFKIKEAIKSGLTEEKIIKPKKIVRDSLIKILRELKVGSKEYEEAKKDKQTKLNQDKNPYYRDLKQWAEDRRAILGDTSKPLGTYEQFYANLDDPQKRKEFYDTVSTFLYYNGFIKDYDNMKDYRTFESLFFPPVKSNFYSDTSNFFNYLFSKYYWFETWMSVLMLYFLFLFIRSVNYSIHLLRRK